MIVGTTGLLWGRRLRWVLLILLVDSRGSMTVAELVEAVTRAGCSIHGRPSKAVSDALRWEVRRGRVLRVARSTYAIDRLPRSTAWWVRQQVRELLVTNVVQPPSDNPAPIPAWLPGVARTLDRGPHGMTKQETRSTRPNPPTS